MLDEDRNRRNVLKGVVAGSFAATGLTGIASAIKDADPEDVEALMKTAEVQAIERTVPNLEIERAEAKALGNFGDSNQDETYAVLAPTNVGRLVVVGHDGGRTAVHHFDERIPDLGADWPRGTTGRLTASGDEVRFQRTATSGERRRILEGVGRTDLVGSDDVVASLTPETGEYYFTHVDADAGRIESITARKAASADGLEIVERRTYERSVSAQGCDCGNEAADLIYCAYQAGSCLSCFIGSPVPPVLAACIVFVCVGGTGGVLLTFIADLGCTDVDPGCVQDCAESVWDDLV
jgi:hypothetical protein